MRKLLRITVPVGLAILLSLTYMVRTAGAEALNTLADCNITALEQNIPSSAAQLDGNNIRLLNWNIQKSSQKGWLADLREFGARSDLVLLQEATLEENLAEAIAAPHIYTVFAPGYRTGNYSTGVMTLSRAPALSKCVLSHREPWLQTPKATGFSRYAIADNEATLLVINMHGVNFSLGSESLAEQLSDASAVIALHEGPVVFSGDFNTWSEQRMLSVQKIMAGLGLNALSYENDQRKQVFGYYLDHIFVRGLRVISTSTQTVKSSDHNPIFATLALDS
jgi:endonuclease/exonuclease/phosphatase (EEP) superfamily protein YafD